MSCECTDCLTANCICTDPGNSCKDCLCEKCGSDENIEEQWLDAKRNVE